MRWVELAAPEWNGASYQFSKSDAAVVCTANNPLRVLAIRRACSRRHHLHGNSSLGVEDDKEQVEADYDGKIRTVFYAMTGDRKHAFDDRPRRALPCQKR
jgi:hypothetical protein